MQGMKFKLAHKRASADKWSLSEKGQKKKLVKILQELIERLQQEPDEDGQEPQPEK